MHAACDRGTNAVPTGASSENRYDTSLNTRVAWAM